MLLVIKVKNIRELYVMNVRTLKIQVCLGPTVNHVHVLLILIRVLTLMN